MTVLRTPMDTTAQHTTTMGISVRPCTSIGSPGLPGLRTSSIRAMFVELFRVTKKPLPVWMALALDRESVMYVTSCFQNPHETFPYVFTFSGTHKRFRIANHDQCISSSRQQHVHTFWGRHESDLPTQIAPGQGDDDYFAFFSLVIVYNPRLVFNRFS